MTDSAARDQTLGRSGLRERLGEPLRFVIAGVINTVVSLAVYWLLLAIVPYGAAYTASFVVGVLTAFALNTYFVFRVEWSWRKLAAFPAVQVVNYLFGLALLWLLIKGIGVPAQYAPLISIPATIPLNFVLSRTLMRRGRSVVG